MSGTVQRVFSFFLMVLVVLQLGGGPVAAEGFVPGIQDLPLMTGLKSSKSEPLVFDSPEGRIVVSPAGGAVSRRQVLDFYRRILPQLGWQRQSETSFLREGEILKLEFSAAGEAGLSVSFSLSPDRKFTR